jgi:phosphoglycolate phosphatase
MVNLFDTVIFDFDYTLADSSPGVIECIRYALEKLGLPPASDQQACQTIGLSLPDTLHRLTGQRTQSETFARLFVERAEVVMADRTVLLDSTASTVNWLKARGIALGIVSTKYRRRIETILRREGLLDPFDVIVGGEDVAKHKPDPESLLKAIDTLGTDNALYVGDSVTDAQTALQAGVPFVAVLSGTTPGEAFGRFHPYRVLTRLSELCDIVVARPQ